MNYGLQVRGTGGGWHRAHRQLPGHRGRPQQGGQEELPQNPLQVRPKQVLPQNPLQVRHKQVSGVSKAKKTFKQIFSLIDNP